MRLLFDPRDVWVGAYWKSSTVYGFDGYPWRILDVWVCIVPMFPLHIRRVR